MNNFKYIEGIDGLRAFAVVIVVLFHYFPGRLASGFIGVDVFFVISGFLVTIIGMDKKNRGSLTINSFMNRRFRRLMPAYLVVVFITLLVSWLFTYPSQVQNIAKDVLFANIGLLNISYMVDDSYFSGSKYYRPMLMLWSIAVEVQFYFLWCICLKYTKTSRLLLLAIGICSFGYCVWYPFDKVNMLFFDPFARLLEFMAGCYVGLIFLDKGFNSFKYGNVCYITGALCMIWSLIFINSNSFVPDHKTLVPVLGSVLILCAIVTKPNWLFTNTISQFIGRMSYSLYLVHWPVIALWFCVFFSPPNPITKIFLVLVSFVLAALIHVLVENRILESRS